MQKRQRQYVSIQRAGKFAEFSLVRMKKKLLKRRTKPAGILINIDELNIK